VVHCGVAAALDEVCDSMLDNGNKVFYDDDDDDDDDDGSNIVASVR
jgi:hypothetical protein